MQFVGCHNQTQYTLLTDCQSPDNVGGAVESASSERDENVGRNEWIPGSMALASDSLPISADSSHGSGVTKIKGMNARTVAVCSGAV
jgi:hypothetical protein